MKLETIKEGVGSLIDSVADGWHHLRESAASAMTRFKPGTQTKLPIQANIDDPFYGSARSWSVLVGELFEDDKRLVVRLEVPGMDKQDMGVEVRDNTLILSGEKRFSGESSDGRWRIMQCAYGRFYRAVPLPVAVRAEKATVTYTNGVLRVELPKANPGKPTTRTIPVE